MLTDSVTISWQAWDKILQELSQQVALFAPLSYGDFQDYERIEPGNVSRIIYNHPKPTTPLKTFFLPVRQNVTLPWSPGVRTIIMGIPACDLAALDILDEMYLQEEYLDIYYAKRRKSTLLIGTGCHSIQKNCHCIRYGIQPYPEKHQDIVLSRLNGSVMLESFSEAGKAFIEDIKQRNETRPSTDEDHQTVQQIRRDIIAQLEAQNQDLPDYPSSRELIASAPEEIWTNYARTCVSCGACSTICPTCTCFLLIDRPDFEKIRQMDTCQYPGFARVAGGEDPLHALADRFRHRYMCKYNWKPVKFQSIACTGCGRCIDACIGKISKNELLTDLASVNAL